MQRALEPPTAAAADGYKAEFAVHDRTCLRAPASATSAGRLGHAPPAQNKPADAARQAGDPQPRCASNARHGARVISASVTPCSLDCYADPIVGYMAESSELNLVWGQTLQSCGAVCSAKPVCSAFNVNPGTGGCRTLSQTTAEAGAGNIETSTPGATGWRIYDSTCGPHTPAPTPAPPAPDPTARPTPAPTPSGPDCYLFAGVGFAHSDFEIDWIGGQTLASCAAECTADSRCTAINFDPTSGACRKVTVQIADANAAGYPTSTFLVTAQAFQSRFHFYEDACQVAPPTAAPTQPAPECYAHRAAGFAEHGFAITWVGDHTLASCAQQLPHFIFIVIKARTNIISITNTVIVRIEYCTDTITICIINFSNCTYIIIIASQTN